MNILFLVFNRPDLTRRVFQRIREAKPEQLFLAADGPRPDREKDAALCAETRAVVAQVDWPCEVHTLFRESNLSCRVAVSSATTWFFEHVEEGIILEDDCLPDPSFFPFCCELLERYRNDERIMHISGANLQPERLSTEYSYYFSKYPYVWGWASWRRAWKHCDADMKSWPDFKRSGQFEVSCPDPEEQTYWASAFERVKEGRLDSWDYAWVYACLARGGLSIVPSVNLISNIGFNAEATHTVTGSPLACMATGSSGHIRHPQIVVRNDDMDRYSFFRHINPRAGLARRLRDSALNKHWWENTSDVCLYLEEFGAA